MQGLRHADKRDAAITILMELGFLAWEDPESKIKLQAGPLSGRTVLFTGKRLSIAHVPITILDMTKLLADPRTCGSALVILDALAVTISVLSISVHSPKSMSIPLGARALKFCRTQCDPLPTAARHASKNRGGPLHASKWM